MWSGAILLKQPTVKNFLTAVGIDLDLLEDLEIFKSACEQANPRYKGGRDIVRFQLENDETIWDTYLLDAIYMLSKELRMRHGETPLKMVPYDMIIALGGARRSPLHRAAYAAQAIAEHRVSAGVLVIAGSTRKLRDDELPYVQDYAKGAITEYDLCVGACEKILKRHPDLNIVTICKEDEKSGNDGVIDEVMAHVELYPTRRPISVACCTTELYVTGLELDLARASRRHGWRDFFASGHDVDPETRFNRTPAIYLSECLTTLRKAAIEALDYNAWLISE